MDSKIVNCTCGERIGVITEDGFMIGNLIFESFNAYCTRCEKYLDYEDFEMEISKIRDDLTGRDVESVIFEF
jgi:hypothetical protein